MLHRLFFLSLICSLSLETAEARHIEVCVLNDQQAPVPDTLITDLLETSSAEFDQHVGISFLEVERHQVPLNLFLSDSAQVSRFRSLCAGGDIAAAFTNRTVPAADWYSFVSPDNSGNVKGNLLGLGNPMGFIVIASASYSASKPDASGRPRIYGTMKHELGHLFYAGHIDDERSFLFPYGYGIPGWTPKTEAVIRDSASRSWKFKDLGLDTLRNRGKEVLAYPSEDVASSRRSSDPRYSRGDVASTSARTGTSIHSPVQ